MPEVDLKEFEARLEECSQVTREVVALLRKAAEQAGPDVTTRAHSKPGSGWGITYKRANRVFCRFDPKHQAEHVWALVSGGDRVALARAGTVSDRDDGPWVTIRNQRDAERLVPLILKAYAEAGVAVKRSTKTP